jgi:putative peptide zinc metalloprotease protein
MWLALTLCVTKVLRVRPRPRKHFGGERYEIGVMMLVLTPCLYCNVSDSWMLPNRWHRAAIGAAGMYVELVLASIACFIWWFTVPGPLNYICLNVMFVSSVSTVMFNANPLLRYDGYYILSDVLEIPTCGKKPARSQSQAGQMVPRPGRARRSVPAATPPMAIRHVHRRLSHLSLGCYVLDLILSKTGI